MFKRLIAACALATYHTLSLAANLVTNPDLAVDLSGWTSTSGNLVTNSDFASDLAGWAVSTTGAGTVTFDSFNGSPAPGSMRLAAPGAADVAHAEQCIAITSQNVDFIIRSYTSAGGGTSTLA